MPVRHCSSTRFLLICVVPKLLLRRDRRFSNCLTASVLASLVKNSLPELNWSIHCWSSTVA
ncbi:hypothetical protein PF010_g11289 [Phytophthora fragariae]|uniref:Uncharacterized protein n=1 Tax=Phytophthora fragariae TaxID=53985 RepID=A0A6G0P2F5_9STRA|nr:hypothetical protein PF010_g11289 [Phytophthora fragariae]KAE9232354.1 hypothetical protein PF004_g9934 [Phytophthora fragariae]KAE9340048.1 hypothetical protein PF008_g11285 [Phytophthora fragariae]